MADNFLVIKAHSNRGVARSDNGRLVGFHFPRSLQRPLPGDRVTLDDNDKLIRIHDRGNAFGRGDRHGRFRPLAANLDRLVVMIAPQPRPSPDLLHRYLVAAEIQKLRVVIVLNKVDLKVPDQAPFSELEALASMGYPVVRVRCRPEIELAGLTGHLEQGISLLAGQSGVGKSSLLNVLVPDLDVQTGELSRVTGKGTHTTTDATLHQLPSGGWLVDTPGVWEYGLWSMPTEELAAGFPEFAEPASRCRFRNCRHDREPGCAVREASESGQLPAFRYQAWLRLLAEQQRLSRS